MGAKKLTENTAVLKIRFAEIAKQQLEIATNLYTGRLYVAKLRCELDKVVGVLCTKHIMSDCTIYVRDWGSFGFMAHKFYNDGIDYRMGSFQESAAWAMQEALDVL